MNYTPLSTYCTVVYRELACVQNKKLVGGWHAELTWHAGIPGMNEYMQGFIETRHYVPSLEQALDLVVAMAKQFGIALGNDQLPMNLFYEGDGQIPGMPMPPDDWRQALRHEAVRRGWSCIY